MIENNQLNTKLCRNSYAWIQCQDCEFMACSFWYGVNFNIYIFAFIYFVSTFCLYSICIFLKSARG